MVAASLAIEPNRAVTDPARFNRGSVPGWDDLPGRSAENLALLYGGVIGSRGRAKVRAKPDPVEATR